MATKKIAKAPVERVDRTSVVFKNQDSGLKLAGIVYRPRNRKADAKLPMIIVGGPMASVKELTLPDIDAERIAGIGICGSGVYLPYGVKDDPRMKAVVSIVPFTIMNYMVTATDEELLKMKADYENGAELMYQNAAGPKEFHLVKDALHFEMYDHEDYVMENLEHIETFFKKYL